MSARITITNEGPQRVRVLLIQRPVCLGDRYGVGGDSHRVQQSIEVQAGESFSVDVDDRNDLGVEVVS